MVEILEEEIHGTIGSRLRKLATKMPDRLALVDGRRSWTFLQFLEESQVFAEAFSKLDKSRPVVLILGEEARTLFVLYGAILAGVPAIPIDLALPPASLAGALRGCQLVLTTPDGRDVVEGLGLGLPIATSPDEISAIAAELPPGADTSTRPDSIALIYMTSGTTGMAKGILVDHARVMYNAWARSQRRYYPGDTRLGLIRSVAYSGTAHVVFSGLLNGGTIVLANFRDLTQDAFAALVEEQNIGDLNLTPSQMQTLARHLSERGSSWQPRIVTLSGEPLFYSDLVSIREQVGWTCQVANLYGCADIGLIAEWVIDDAECQMHDVVPVGRAYLGRRIEIHDQDGRPLPPGQTGEIVVFGRYFGQGYWNNPEATAERFQAMDADGLCRFRTGDLGMIDQNGLLHHRGRQDTKVKVRGHFVDLRTIEGIMRSVPGVANAAVTVGETSRGQSCINGYAEKAPGGTLTSHGLRKALDGLAPDFAIPRRLIVLESFPLTSGGKVDVRALPRPGAERPSGMPSFEPLSGEYELGIGRIWSDMLEIEEIGRHDDFFDLGGDSLSAMEVGLRIQKEFSLPLDIAELFLSPSIEKMAKAIQSKINRPEARHMTTPPLAPRS